MNVLVERGGVLKCGSYLLAILLLGLSATTADATTGQKRKLHVARRSTKSAILNLERDAGGATSDEDIISVRNVEAASDFLKRSLFEFFHSLEQKGTKHSQLPKPKPKLKLKRNSLSKLRKLHHRGSSKLGKRRQKILLRNDTDTGGQHERKCKFPFIYDGKTQYACMAFDENDKNGDNGGTWCSTTSNYDRDMRWTRCLTDGTPVKRHNSGAAAERRHLPTFTPMEEPEEAYPNVAEKHKWEEEVETMAEKKTLPGLSSSTDKKEASIMDQLCENCTPKNNTEASKGNMAEDIVEDEKNDERIHTLVSKEVDTFIGSVLAKHGVPDTEQKELLALNQKLSTELAQEVSCKMNINTKIGSARDECKQFNLTEPVSNNTTAPVTTTTTSPASSSEQKSNITTGKPKLNDELLKGEVDNFISNILSQHGVPSGKQDEIVKFIRKASTDIADQISYVVAYAKAGGITKNDSEAVKGLLRNTTSLTSASNATKNSDSSIHSAVDSFLGLVLEKNGVPENQQNDILRWNAQLSTDISDQVNSIVEDAKKLHEDFKEEETNAASKIKNTHGGKHDGKPGGLVSQLKPFLPDEAGSDVSKEVGHMHSSPKPIFKDPHFEKDPLLQQLYNKAHEKDSDSKDSGVGGKEAPYEENKSYDDVSTENDIEIGLDDVNLNENGDSDAKATAPDAIDSVTGNVKNVTEHKISTGDPDWDRYLMEKSSNQAALTKADEAKKERESIDTAKEHLDEEEKNMINYVSDSILQSVKNDAPTSNDTNKNQNSSNNNDMSFKKLENGKKPYSIFRVNSNNEVADSKSKDGEVADDKANKMIPGAKNINIIIINNQNASSLDLNEIEKTIARSGESFTETNVQKASELHSNSADKSPADKSNGSKTLFLLLNTTATKEKLSNHSLSNNTATIVGGAAKENKTMLAAEKPQVANAPLSVTDEQKANNPPHFNFSRATPESRLLSAEDPETHRKTGLVTMNYAPEEVVIHTFGGNANGAKCKFPFIFDGDTYFNCLTGYRDKPWCSATANYDKLPIWGFCDDKELRSSPGNVALNAMQEKTKKQEELAAIVHSQGEEVISKHSGMKTYGGNANGARCVIPFVYDGQTHMRCIPRNDGTAWCAASHSYDIHPVWGNCCDDDTYRC